MTFETCIITLVLYIFQLILKVTSYLFSYMTIKYSRFSQVFYQKYFKFISRKKVLLIMHYSSRILLLSIEDMIIQRVYNGRYVLVPLIFSNFEIVYILLRKIIAFYMQVTGIKFEIWDLEWHIWISFFIFGNLELIWYQSL